MRNELKPENLQSYIRAEIPEIDDIASFEEGMYDAMGDLAIYIREGVSNKTISKEKLANVFHVMNAMGASKNLEIQNILVVGLFEILADKDGVIDEITQGLEGHAEILFNRTLSGWSSD